MLAIWMSSKDQSAFKVRDHWRKVSAGPPFLKKKNFSQVLVCDDVNVVDALDAKESVSSVTHVICIGNEAGVHDCVPIRCVLKFRCWEPEAGSLKILGQS
jgi:hypothetical protein